MATIARNAARALVGRAAKDGQHGTVADRGELEQVNRDMGNRIPGWYLELVTTVPICGLELGWQAYERGDDFDGIKWLYWSDPLDMRSESLECYPGIAILQRGYINVASDSTSGGDPYFIPTDQGDNPPLFQVYHDVSDDPEVIVQHGRQLVVGSLSEFLNKALIGVIPASRTQPQAP